MADGKTQTDIILEILMGEKVVSSDKLRRFTTKKSLVTVISNLRKEGYKIKWSRGNYYFGGKGLSF